MAIKTHLSFVVPAAKDIGARVISHFSKLRYHLIDENNNAWTLQRGNKLATFWRFDIRAYATTLTVRAIAHEGGGYWMICDWEVWTCGTIATGADISTLQAEGHQLESAFRELA
jgi:hypothetical protein